MDDYEQVKYRSFNDFFTRRIKPERRPFCTDPAALVSPCDARVSVYRISDDSRFSVKGFDYTAAALLGDEALAAEYAGGGTIAVFRLTVTDYHRYFYIDDGQIAAYKFIKGRLHTVQPVALGRRRVFTENCRAVTVIDTARFGRIAQVEVGALMVGKIVNHQTQGACTFGQEKGYFKFGGSTVCLLFPKDSVELDEELWQNTAQGKETQVKCGERIGRLAQ